MNIFYLDKDPVVAAQQQVDKHVVKMPLETAQMLCSAFEVGSAPYRRTHYNHPSTVWSRSSKANYQWLIKHGYALCEEYTKRYNKEHKCKAIIKWCEDNQDSLSFDSEEFTDPPQCMPDDAKRSDSVAGYRTYYNTHKSYIFNWTKRNPPEWVNITKV
jgi:Pyrimidine dimer DNA glycosylase